MYSCRPISIDTVLLCTETWVNRILKGGAHSSLQGYTNIYLSTSAEQNELNMHLIYITIAGVQEWQQFGWQTRSLLLLWRDGREIKQFFLSPSIVSHMAPHKLLQKHIDVLCCVIHTDQSFAPLHNMIKNCFILPNQTLSLSILHEIIILDHFCAFQAINGP